MSHAHLVRCPACQADYLLPRSLAGPLGARVTCPACREVFDVDADGRPVEVPADGPVRAFAPRSRAADDERAVAAAVLDECAARCGPALEAAAREGRLFRAHGPELLAAFDEYRRRAGERASAQAFREEVVRRWRVELIPLAEARG